MLKVKQLNSFYGKIQTVWNLSLEIDEGEIIAIIGANGAGKTTILKSIVGLVEKTGAIEFEGKNISSVSAHKMVQMGISYVPEGRKVFPEMSVRENLILGSYNKRAKLERSNSLEYVLDIFPRLKERIDHLAGNLSGGEQQMLAIGRGLMARPKLILLDEPSLGIAPVLTDEIFRNIEEIKKETTIVLVEQHVHRALAICDRGYVVETGQIHLTGTRDELETSEDIKEAYLGI
ncbi:ABC transporter ATP-binding protein [Lentibacillus sp. CBA3610]|uniref:ABC transporter ATP-binding protein n=1 Tax=Lentibacillus sp. CBA3610 TaxID=2518176 RepID=UPI001C3EB0DD|nr:ABC transporter ATP-binding protein [Lentibacillus sp. CBA3610]